MKPLHARPSDVGSFLLKKFLRRFFGDIPPTRSGEFDTKDTFAPSIADFNRAKVHPCFLAAKQCIVLAASAGLVYCTAIPEECVRP